MKFNHLKNPEIAIPDIERTLLHTVQNNRYILNFRVLAEGTVRGIFPTFQFFDDYHLIGQRRHSNYVIYTFCFRCPQYPASNHGRELFFIFPIRKNRQRKLICGIFGFLGCTDQQITVTACFPDHFLREGFCRALIFNGVLFTENTENAFHRSGQPGAADQYKVCSWCVLANGSLTEYD